LSLDTSAESSSVNCESASDSVTAKGYLLDVSCATKHAGEDGFAQGHDKDCLQMCAKSGFGVLASEGKFVKFNDEGNKQVGSIALLAQ
jgi:hypothetical protein